MSAACSSHEHQRGVASLLWRQECKSTGISRSGSTRGSLPHCAKWGRRLRTDGRTDAQRVARGAAAPHHPSLPHVRHPWLRGTRRGSLALWRERRRLTLESSAHFFFSFFFFCKLMWTPPFSDRLTRADRQLSRSAEWGGHGSTLWCGSLTVWRNLAAAAAAGF